MASFEDLEVWKRAVGLSVEIYRELQGLRDYGFKDQITRSGLSVPSNIAEGMERVSTADRVRLLRIAQSSCAELRTQIYIGMEIGYIDRASGQRWIQETREISAMLIGLIRSIEDGK